MSSIVSSRYELLLRLAAGGMATVFVGRLRGAGGFTRLVAIKRAHPEIVRDPHARAGIVEEARLASKLHHPNVVAVQDVEELDGELLLIMDYVEGASLAQLVVAANAAGSPLPPAVAVRVVLDACAGLHAAHNLTDDFGAPMPLVHRDVSPQNILIGLDGVARLSDFGIAKGSGDRALVQTVTGALKGKLAYMAPEYVLGDPFDARADVWAMGVVAWELLANRRLFRGSSEADTLRRIVEAPIPSLSGDAAALPADLDDVVKNALVRSPSERFPTALAFSRALETAARKVGLVAETSDVAELVKRLLGKELLSRRATLRERVGAPAPSASAERGIEEDTTVEAVQPVEAAGRTDSVTLPLERAGPADAVEPETETLQELSTLGRSGMARSDARAIPGERRSRPWLIASAVLAGGAAMLGLAALARRPAARDPSAPAAASPASPPGEASLPLVVADPRTAPTEQAAQQVPQVVASTSTATSRATAPVARAPSARPAKSAALSEAPSAPPPRASAPAQSAPPREPTFAPNPYAPPGG